MVDGSCGEPGNIHIGITTFDLSNIYPEIAGFPIRLHLVSLHHVVSLAPLAATKNKALDGVCARHDVAQQIEEVIRG